MPNEHTPHPDDPRTLLTDDIGLVESLMRRTDVDSVILQRPHLRDRYKEIFNENGGQTIENWHEASGVFLSADTINIRMADGQVEPLSITMRDEFVHEAMKKAAPPEIWSDFCDMAGIVAKLSENTHIHGTIFPQRPGQTVYDELTRVFHHHCYDNSSGPSITAHVSTTDAGIDILLGVTSLDLMPDADDKYETVIPSSAKILRTKAADIAFFKPHVLHRKSPESYFEGRSALAVYQSYQYGIVY